MNGYFTPQITPKNVGNNHQLAAVDINCERRLNMQNDTAERQDATYYNHQYYPANINFGVQNVYYNSFSPQKASFVPPSSANNNNNNIQSYQQYPQQQHFVVEPIVAQNKVLDARPESLWELKSDPLKLPSLSNAHAAELRNGFNRVSGQKLSSDIFTNDEVDAVSVLASLGRIPTPSSVVYRDGTSIINQKQQHLVVDRSSTSSSSYCQNLPQVNQLNQSNAYEFNNSQHLYRPTLHRPPASERCANNGNGANLEALKLKSDVERGVNYSNNNVNGYHHHSNLNYDHHTLNNYATLQTFGQISPRTQNFSSQNYASVGASLPIMQNLALKLDTNVANCPVAGPLSQESPAYKSFCENSLNVDGRTSSWRPTIVQKLPVVKNFYRNNQQQQQTSYPNEPSNQSIVVQTGLPNQIREIAQQQQLRRVTLAPPHLYNGQIINKVVQLSPNGLLLNRNTREFTVIQRSPVESNLKIVTTTTAAINQSFSSAQGFVSPKIVVPRCQLGDILAKKYETMGGGPSCEKITVDFGFVNNSVPPKAEHSDPTSIKNEMAIVEKSQPMADAKDFVFEFIRQMDSSVRNKSPKVENLVQQVKQSIPPPIVPPETKPAIAKKKAAKPTKASLKLIEPSSSTATKAKREKFQTPYVTMPKVIEKDPLSLSESNFSALLAINTKKASLKRKEKIYIPLLPPFLGSPVKTTKKKEGVVVKSVRKRRLSEISNSSSQIDQIESSFDGDPTRIRLWNGSYETEESLLRRLKNNISQPICHCDCYLNGAEIKEEVEGPYYTHLGATRTVPEMRTMMEERFGETGAAIRIEKVIYTGREGKTADGCPIAKWIIRRSSYDEKVLCLVRERRGHTCETAVLCVLIVVWDGVPADQADPLYDCLKELLPVCGIPTNRRCETNEKRNCACQGVVDTTAGASFSFGCSWSMYFNTCKFAKSVTPKKFKLTSKSAEKAIEVKCNLLADTVGPLYKRMAPASYKNQTVYSEIARKCRLGNELGNPWSGITACVDFCAHAHKDIHNMMNGCTTVVTLTKHRGLEKPDDEQLHVLPLYVMDNTDEYGSVDGQMKKINRGLEILTKYPMNLRIRTTKLPSSRQRNKMYRQKSKSAKKSQLDLDYVASPTGSLPDMSQSKVKKKLYDQTTTNFHETSRTTESIPPTFGGNYYNGASNNINQTAVFNNGQQQQFYPPPNANQNNTFNNCNGYSFGFAYDPNSSYSATNLPINQNCTNGYVNYTAGYGSNWSYNGPKPQNFESSSWNQQQGTTFPSNNWPTASVAQGIIVGNNNYSQTPTGSNSFSQYSSIDQRSSDLGCSSAKRKLSFDSVQGETTVKPIVYAYTENESAFEDPFVGGVAVALSHGSVLFEVAKKELHATTALRVPDRRDPKRISLVFYQHKHLNYKDHGSSFYAANQLTKKKAKKNSFGPRSPDTDGDSLSDRSSASSPDLLPVDELAPTDDWNVPCKRWTTTTRPTVVTVNANKSSTCRVSGQYSLKG